MRRKQIISLIAIVLVFLLTSSFLFVKRIITKTYPQTKGKLELTELKNEIKIYRDNFGIPYIEADNEYDLFFALGFVHAQDRLFQMEITKRAGMGRLSEILGPEALEYDIIFRTAEFTDLAQRLYEHSSLTSKNICKAYTDGINSFINYNKNNYPIEFDLLKFAPQKWEPYHVFLIARLIAWELNIGWWTDIVYGQLIEKIPAEKLKTIIPKYPPNGPTIINEKVISFDKKNVFSTNSITNESEANSIKLYSGLLKSFFEMNIGINSLFNKTFAQSGSNSWVISGKKSKSKKPILANDPHLIYSLPSKWYIVSLHSPEVNVSGVSIPGSPSIVIGKNSSIAWGLTNLMLDDCDLYLETIDSARKKYLFNNVWKDLKIRIDTIIVKDSANVILEIKKTHRGPLIEKANKFLRENKINKSISIKWTGYELSDEILAFYKINTAKNYKDFREAIRFFNCPAQNFLCADSDGNIFYKAGGKIPIKSNYNSIFLLDGSNSLNDWKGYFDFNSQPELLNPPEGFITTNNNPPSKSWIPIIGNLWEPTSRAERIKELLSSKEKFDVNDFIEFQKDVISPYAQKISKYIPLAFSSVKIKDEVLQRSISLLNDYNGDLNKYSPSAAIYNIFLANLIRNTFADEMGEDLFKQFVFVGNVPLRVIEQLLEDTTSNATSWFDDIITPEIESKEQIIIKSFIEAVNYLTEKFGDDITKWKWGDIHKVTFKHLFAGKSKILDKLINIGPFSIGGDQTTLFNTSFKYEGNFENFLGPSMRQIVNMANLENSKIVIPGGQSGNIGHKNYKDQALLWLFGEYVDFNTDPDSYRNYQLLRLIPSNK